MTAAECYASAIGHAPESAEAYECMGTLLGGELFEDHEQAEAAPRSLTLTLTLALALALALALTLTLTLTLSRRRRRSGKQSRSTARGTSRGLSWRGCSSVRRRASTTLTLTLPSRPNLPP
jgi:hypothetical protein